MSGLFLASHPLVAKPKLMPFFHLGKSYEMSNPIEFPFENPFQHALTFSHPSIHSELARWARWSMITFQKRLPVAMALTPEGSHFHELVQIHRFLSCEYRQKILRLI